MIFLLVVILVYSGIEVFVASHQMELGRTLLFFAVFLCVLHALVNLKETLL